MCAFHISSRTPWLGPPWFNYCLFFVCFFNSGLQWNQSKALVFVYHNDLFDFLCYRYDASCWVPLCEPNCYAFLYLE